MEHGTKMQNRLGAALYYRLPHKYEGLRPLLAHINDVPDYEQDVLFELDTYGQLGYNPQHLQLLIANQERTDTALLRTLAELVAVQCVDASVSTETDVEEALDGSVFEQPLAEYPRLENVATAPVPLDDAQDGARDRAQETAYTVDELLEMIPSEYRVRVVNRRDDTPADAAEVDWCAALNASPTSPEAVDVEPYLDAPETVATLGTPERRPAYAALAALRDHYTQQGDVEGLVTAAFALNHPRSAAFLLRNVSDDFDPDVLHTHLDDARERYEGGTAYLSEILHVGVSD